MPVPILSSSVTNSCLYLEDALFFPKENSNNFPKELTSYYLSYRKYLKWLHRTLNCDISDFHQTSSFNEQLYLSSEIFLGFRVNRCVRLSVYEFYRQHFHQVSFLKRCFWFFVDFKYLKGFILIGSLTAVEIPGTYLSLVWFIVLWIMWMSEWHISGPWIRHLFWMYI